jgi:hypothetical protein
VQVTSLSGVLNTGALAKPGDKVLGGVVVGIRQGHIGQPVERTNMFTGEREWFDPKQVMNVSVTP